MQGRDGLECALRVAASPSQSPAVTASPGAGEVVPLRGSFILADRQLANAVRLRGSALGSTGTATAVTEGVVFFFFLENATFLQKKLQFFLEKGRFPIDSLVIIGM